MGHAGDTDRIPWPRGGCCGPGDRQIGKKALLGELLRYVTKFELHRPDGRDAHYLAGAGGTEGSGSLLHCRSAGVHVVDDQYALPGYIGGTTELATEGSSTGRKLKAPYRGAKFL